MFPNLGQSPIRDVVLATPSEISPANRPQISLHLLVKNGESCVGRLIENVGPFLDEVVVVLNDTTDATEDVLLSSICKVEDTIGRRIELHILRVTAETHPEFYIQDVPSTYDVGVPLTGETYSGPFTGKPLLADWAGIRNLGWERCSRPWRLFLDADDLVIDPECLPGLCLALEANDIDLACSRYVFSPAPDGAGARGDSYRERLARNCDYLLWQGITHEVLRGSYHTANLDGSLAVHDLKDSTGEGIRVPGRCFKVLYHHARSVGWDNVMPRELIYLAMECRDSMPRLARAALELYLQKSLWPEERAWARVMLGEIFEKRDEYETASASYEAALREHPGSKAAFRLCRSRFHEGKWRQAIEAYETGVANKVVLQLLDNGPRLEHMSKILVSVCYEELGNTTKAYQFASEAIEVFPDNSALRMLQERYEDMLRKGQ
jgi:glycosyltransferase involved in cell wall biosynthesis